MKKFRVQAVIVVTFSIVSASLQGCRVATAQNPPTQAPNLELTVYKNDFAMVRDQRQVNLDSGTTALRLPGVSKELDPQSVLFDWSDKTDRPDVLSTTYNLGINSSKDLLQRLVGQKVQMVWRGQDGRVGDTQDGVLEEANDGTVLHTNDSYLVNPGGEIVASAKQSVTTMPELVASVRSGSKHSSDMALSYLTRGMSWTADYVAKIAPDGKHMRLECWGTITNTTGSDFPAAKLNLVAGNPNRSVLNVATVSEPSYQNSLAKRGTDMSGFDGTVVANRPATLQPVGDLYTYRLPAKSDVMQQQMNRAKIFSCDDTPIVRTYSIGLNDGGGAENRQNAQVAIAFSNSEKQGLGMPLPEGSLRAYDSDGGSEAYTGAATIADTPKDERVSLTLSDAFDVFSKSMVTNYKKLGRHRYSRTYRVVVHNEKKTDETVKISDSFESTSKIVDSSIPANKPSAGSFEWKVPVKAGGQTV